MNAIADKEQRPLNRFSVVHTTDLDAAREAVSDVYLPHHLVRASAGPMEMILNACGNRGVTLGYLTYQAETTLHMPAPEDFYHLNLTTAGHTSGSRDDGRRAETRAGDSGLLLLPDRDCEVKWSADAEQLILRFSRGRLENHASDLLGQNIGEPVEFDFGVDLSSARGRSLLASVEFMATEMNRVGGIADNSLIVEQLESFVMSNLLLAVPNTFSETLATPAPTVNLGKLKPVVDFMEANADEAITPNELARVGHMSIRTLHASFQQVLQTTPMEYLRRIRMERVRAELINNSDPDLKITGLAARWGFYHPSRFAARYRDMYGELPSETVLRHR
jgi:AraC-like DNA-binding protein